ncbi:hypothetical protein [Fodinibacter luteus]
MPPGHKDSSPRTRDPLPVEDSMLNVPPAAATVAENNRIPR